MESSAVYWSSWAGLSDMTSAMQVQRGLGSSKLAISSVGGTINVLAKLSDMKEGGSFSSGFGNTNYLKVQGSCDTGLMKNGLSASVLLSSTTGYGYVDGTKFEGKKYYIAFGYKASKHDIQFTFTVLRNGTTKEVHLFLWRPILNTGLVENQIQDTTLIGEL